VSSAPKGGAIETETQGDAMQVQPYLSFEGHCEEAIEFYRKALGAKVEMMMRFKDAPKGAMPGDCTPAMEEKVMHAALKIGETTVMASDGRMQPGARPSFQGFALSLDAKDEAHAKRLFGALSEGGQVQQPLAKTFFSQAFGMLADRFGVSWIVIVPQQRG
jgi:PhnB protein